MTFKVSDYDDDDEVLGDFVGDNGTKENCPTRATDVGTRLTEPRTLRNRNRRRTKPRRRIDTVERRNRADARPIIKTTRVAFE